MAEIWTIWDAEMGYSQTSLNQSGGERPEQRATHDGAEPSWGVAQVRPDGRPWMHIFPHSALEWRSALYGIDPEDVDTLLDVILHGPWIPSPHDALALADPAAAAVLADTHGFPTCWTPGVSDVDRLQAQLARIDAVKKHRVKMEPEKKQTRQDALVYVGSKRVAPADPLEPIKSMTRLDPVRVEARRMAASWYRDSMTQPVRPTFEQKPPDAFIGMQPPGGGL